MDFQDLTNSTKALPERRREGHINTDASPDAAQLF
jgi:hypothetical protein